MPFGATCELDGETRFRLWAPSAVRVDLMLDVGQGESATAMACVGGGWHEAPAKARAGARYRFRLPDGLVVPDPASRFNPQDVHAASEVIDPSAFDWQDDGWKGRPWNEAVVYELHVGTFTPQGTYAAAEGKLDYLVALGITAVELMPLADFPGRRGWGYDGVLHYAPEAGYGRPDELKSFIQAAHQRGLMVLLDVVYNHFGPDGNYLYAYAAGFFTDRHHTPWGKAINYDGEGSHVVRDFFIHNALYWLEEFHFDGLRLDAVHAIVDDSKPDVLQAMAQAVREGPARDRHVHLVLENDLNAARRLTRKAAGAADQYTAQWNDDFHHAAHALLTGERDGYYADYPADSAQLLGRCLGEGFAFQGDASPFRDGEARGEASTGLLPGAMVNFLQNHDQIGNRAFGERLASLSEAGALRVMTAVLLLAPQAPLLFMGDEFAAATPFLFFCDFSGDLAEATREGRRKEFSRFERFADPAVRDRIPDPLDPATYERSKLDWSCLPEQPHAEWLELHRRLLGLRRDVIAPLIPQIQNDSKQWRLLGQRGLRVEWPLTSGGSLLLLASLGEKGGIHEAPHAGRLIYEAAAGKDRDWSVAWLVTVS